MNAAWLEAFLARLYTDDALRRDFCARPAEVARAAGLDAATVDQLQAIDRDGLHLAADSYARKRAAHARLQQRAARDWTQRLSAFWRK
jgi:hypothetical protein